MYSGWQNRGGPKAFPSHETMATYPKEQAHNHAQPQTATLSPRSLEPRPALQASLSERSMLPRPQEALRYQDPPASEYRSTNQSLPGLKDILNPPPYPSTQKPYGTSWNASAHPPTSHQGGDGHYAFHGVHPPMVLHPPMIINYRHPPHLNKPPELPGPDTNRQGQPALPSPRGGYPDSSREYTDLHPGRSNHASMPSTLSSAPPGLYQSVGSDESQYPNHAAVPYRQDRSGPIPTSGRAESHGKYLGIEDIAGEGEFHVYADGYRIPTQVDGEQVNPAWGLTKAKKPRKRLALACLDCREKKIRCEPGTNSCIQCEKAMRPCRRAPEKSSQPDTATNTLWVGGSPVRKSMYGSERTPSSTLNIDYNSLSKRKTRGEHSPPFGSNKRQRSISPRSYGSPDDGPLPREETLPIGFRRPGFTEDREDTLMWENDPYAVDPGITLHLLDLYFAHINKATLCIFPRNHFLNWLKNYPNKTQNERMLLYAMLAAASIFADDRLTGFGKQCAQIAGDAVSSVFGRFSVAIAQSKLFLALYHFAKGSMGVCWDFSGSGIRTVFYMNLNAEAGCLDDDVSRSQSRFEFAFSPEQLAECKRRTFWSCFLQDRYAGAARCTIKPKDIFVRLPCADDMYEQSIVSNAPYLSNDIRIELTAEPAQPNSPVAPIAWLLLAAGIWGEVTDFVYRASHQPNSSYRDTYEEFYSETHSRLQAWLSRLPEHLQYTESNLARSIQEGYVGTFVSLHALYHLSLIKLNRYMRHSVIPDAVSRNIRTANNHGHQILQIMTALHFANREISAPADGQPPVCTFSTHFPGYAILSAIDIVSAGGLDSNLKATLDEIEGSLACLHELAEYWGSAIDQLRSCRKRFYQLKNVTISPNRARGGCWLGRKWGIKTPLEQEYGPDEDCIYGLGEREADEAQIKYFDAFKEG